jgi:hypothetical protein
VGVGNSIIKGTDKIEKIEKPKLIIHETDCHGCGNIYFNGNCDNYSYDDSYFGDVRLTVEALIKIGFIKAEDVVILTDDVEVYKLVEKGLRIN